MSAPGDMPPEHVAMFRKVLEDSRNHRDPRYMPRRIRGEQLDALTPQEQIERAKQEQAMRLDRTRRRIEAALRGAEAEAKALPGMALRLEKLTQALADSKIREARCEAQYEYATRAVDASPAHRAEVSSIFTSQIRRDWTGPCVYFLSEEACEFVKIGWCLDSPTKRAADLQTGCVRTLFVAAAIHGDRLLEGKLHRHFALERQRGEWFRMSERIASLILELHHGHDVTWFISKFAEVA